MSRSTLARAPRAKAKFGQYAATLQRARGWSGGNRPGRAARREACGPVEAEAARERSQGVTRRFILEVRVGREWCALRLAEYSLPACVDPGHVGFDARVRLGFAVIEGGGGFF